MGKGSFCASAVLDLLAPRRCAACESPLFEGERGFCGGCALLIDRIPHGPAAYVYGGPLADAIRRVKYVGRTEHLPALAELLAEPASHHAGLVDAVVSVPLHPRRLRERGFDHVALLGARLARLLGVPFRPRCLRRVRATPPQAGLPAADRARNVRGAFRGRVDPGRRRLLLFDDVRTTGATLEAAAAALREAGTDEVRRLALAGTEPLQ